MAGRIYRCHPGIGEPVTGVALVARDNFSARYDLDRITGTFSRPAHALHGHSYDGRVLVLDIAKGGVATAWMLHEMKSRGISPLALVLNASNPIMAQGAAFAGLPFVDRFEVDITAAVRSGELVTVDPVNGTLEVHGD